MGGKSGIIVSAGVNDYGDGPESYVGYLLDMSEADAALCLASRQMFDALVMASAMLPLAGDMPAVRRVHAQIEAAIAEAKGEKTPSDGAIYTAFSQTDAAGRAEMLKTDPEYQKFNLRPSEECRSHLAAQVQAQAAIECDWPVGGRFTFYDEPGPQGETPEGSTHE